jgi:hypothetical protein
LVGLQEPVRRYLNHALAPGAAVGRGRRFRMVGRIKVGFWLAFDAEQQMSAAGHGFTWTARAGLGPFRLLRVVDRYSLGAGSTEGRLFGRFRFLHADDEDTTRSAAGRAAVESIMDPTSLLPDNDVRWHAENDDLIVARFDVPPERAEVRLRINATGSPRSVEIMRWGDAGQDHFGYIPFGADIHAERRIGDLVLPSELTVGWWYGTARYQPFFQATIRDGAPRREGRSMWVLNRVVNPIVRAVLRSPLHPLLSRRLVLLRIPGRRSERAFELPVAYVCDEAGILVTVGAPERKQWWHNIDGPTPITVVLRGRTIPGVAELVARQTTTRVHIALPAEPPSSK